MKIWKIHLNKKIENFEQSINSVQQELNRDQIDYVQSDNRENQVSDAKVKTKVYDSKQNTKFNKIQATKSVQNELQIFN